MLECFLSHEQIAALAYHLYLENGCQEGRDVQDWLSAEEILTQQPARKEAAPTSEPTRPHDIHSPQEARPLDAREYPFARDERGSAGREEIRRQTTRMRPAARQSQRPQERSGQAR